MWMVFKPKKKVMMVGGTELGTDAQTKALSQGETLRDAEREGLWCHFLLVGVSSHLYLKSI